MKKKNKYERPLLQTFELQLTQQLLNLSSPTDYVNGGDPLSSGAPSLDSFFEDEEI